MRAGELRSLKVSSFDLEGFTVTLEAAYSKRRREDRVPLRPDTAATLRSWLSGKLPPAPAFRMPNKHRLAKVLREDLEAAEIDYIDGAGRVADFHSLRHTTGSLLAASGAHPKVAQNLMRHSKVELTLGRYSHVYKGQEAEAVANLPDLTAPSTKSQAGKATGTLGSEKNYAICLAKQGGKQCNSLDNYGIKGQTSPENQNPQSP